MQACGGAAVTGSLQQPIWTKPSAFSPKGFNFNGFPHHVNPTSVKPQLAYIKASLATGQPPSSVSVPVGEVEGDFSSTPKLNCPCLNV